MTDVQMVPLTYKGADGKDVSVEIPVTVLQEAVKDTHVAKDRFETDLNRRVQGIIKNQNSRKAEELLDDESFVAQVLEKHGQKGGGAEGDAAAQKQLRDAIAKAVADVEAKRVKPLEEKLTAKEKREDELLRRDLERQIIQASAPLARDGLLKSSGRGLPAPIVAMLADMFAYDEESGEFYVADGDDNFVLSTSSDRNTTYKGVEEFVTEWFDSPDRADFRKPGQAGSDARGTKGGDKGGAGVIVLTYEQGQNHATFMDALKKVGGDYSRVRVKRPDEQI